MRPSSLRPAARPVSGLPTSSTPGIVAASASAVRIAAGAPPWARVWPSGAAKTIWAASPDCCGKRCSSRSVARWASESGIVNSLTSVPPMVVLAATIATAAITQMAIVRQPWRAQARARRARAPSVDPLLDDGRILAHAQHLGSDVPDGRRRGSQTTPGGK